MKHAPIIPALIALLSGGCATKFSTPDEPDLHIAYHDLDLESPNGRAALFQRVADQSRDYCSHYASQIIPRAMRTSDTVCITKVTEQIYWSMPQTARRAYKHAEKERTPTP